MAPDGTGQYATVNGLKLYYEIHGSGEPRTEPLVLLHGGVGGIPMFGPNVAALASNRKVIGVELQGHGHTADIDRPLSYEAMADDVAALIGHLGIGPASVMGFSLGGGVALQTAIRHAAVVRKLIVVSAPCRRNGWFPEVVASTARLGPETAAQIRKSPLFQMYPDVNWETLFTKLSALLRKDYDWSREIAAIPSPVMIVFADADSVRPAHIVEFFALLGGGLKDAGLDGAARPQSQLAILPGLTHYTIASSPALAEAVGPFLDGA